MEISIKSEHLHFKQVENTKISNTETCQWNKVDKWQEGHVVECVDCASIDAEQDIFNLIINDYFLRELLNCIDSSALVKLYYWVLLLAEN